MDTLISLAKSKTWNASKITYIVGLLLVDKNLQADFFRTYAYFRWVDDMIDEGKLEDRSRIDFIARQEELINNTGGNRNLNNLLPEEGLIHSLTQSNNHIGSGLHSFVENMFSIIKFDSFRKGRLISEIELNWYSERLSKAVVDGLQYFIGNHLEQPASPYRYSAGMAAHITHMLRDMLTDISNGFINIPLEHLLKYDIDTLNSQSIRPWVITRVNTARRYFQEGEVFIKALSVKRCKIAAHLYNARFKSILDRIERDDFYLRVSY